MKHSCRLMYVANVLSSKFAWLVLLIFYAINACAEADTTTVTSFDCTRIGNITILTDDVFPEKKRDTMFHKTINFLHVKTTLNTIKKELLFARGDCFSKALMDESARNLRFQKIFSDVTISVLPSDIRGEVDIQVNTRDRFTLRAEASASHKAGETQYRMSVGDKNLFGLNMDFHYSDTTTADDNKTRYVYRDNRFFNRYAFDGVYQKDHGGKIESYAIDKPFRTLLDRNGFGVLYEKDDRNLVYSLDGGGNVEIPQFKEVVSFHSQFEMGDRLDSYKLGGRLTSSQKNYYPELISSTTAIEFPPYIPERLENIDFSISQSISKREDFVVLQGVDSLIYREDIALGSSYWIEPGVQWRQDSGVIKYHPTLVSGYRRTHYNGEHILASTYLQSAMRFYAGDIKEVNITAFYHGYYFPTINQTWVGGISYRYRYGSDILNEPVTLGGDQGFRGYKAGTFTGNKALLLSLEWRQRFPFQWEHIALGHAIFADAGYAWERSENPRFQDLRINVGWGLRFDIPTLFGENVLRFDIATPLQSGKVLVSVVLGQVFRYDQLAENSIEEF